MTLNPIRTERHLTQSEIFRLVSGTSTSHDREYAVQHLEDCPDCLLNLEQTAADQDSWKEVEVALKSELGDDVRFETASAVAFGSHPQDNSKIANRSTEFQFLEPASHPELLGKLGRYDIESFLGSGGMGIVFKAFDRDLNRTVAIKCLAPYLCRNATARNRFAREARAAAAISHESIVAIHNVEADQPTPFIVLQYVPGPTLQARVEQDGPLPIESILRIALQAARGLAAAHAQGVVHRDIKPGNILLEENSDRALVTDFGLARAADDASLTQSGTISGTPNYMSPEQARGDVIDYRSDLFSLGAVMYFMAAGYPPFRAERAVAVLNRVCHEKHRSAGQIRHDMPRRAIDLIDRLLEKKPTNRYASAEEVAVTIQQVLAEYQSPKEPSWFPIRWLSQFFGATDRSARRRQRRVQRLGLGAIAFALLAWAAFGWMGLGIQDSVQDSSTANPASPQSSASIDSGDSPWAESSQSGSSGLAANIVGSTSDSNPTNPMEPSDLDLLALPREASQLEWEIDRVTESFQHSTTSWTSLSTQPDAWQQAFQQVWFELQLIEQELELFDSILSSFDEKE